MRKVLIVLIAIMAITINAQEYVDLGLPSGTLWKASGEPSLYTHDEALRSFFFQLPTMEQYKELINLCEWEWVVDESNNVGLGYKVIGLNKNSIFFSTNIYTDCDKKIEKDDNSGCYWSSSLTYDKFLERYFGEGLVFERTYHDIGGFLTCRKMAVHLVKGPF